MSRNREQVKRRNEAIRADYQKLCDQKEHGVRKFTHDYVLATLSQKYYLSTYTIDDIVYYRKEK